MKDVLISIIVPVYKVEKYLAQCVNSILNQTLVDFELILVDDGSPDKCPRLCDMYERMDDRVKVIHKSNGGLSDARNVGIDIAKGKYIAFVDSDDFISHDMYERLYNNIIKYDADLAMCLSAHIGENTSEISNHENGEIKVFKGEGILKALFEKKLNNFAWNKLYKSELFKEIRYPVGKIYEDLFTTYKILSLCSTVVYDSSILYGYRVRTDSIMGSARKIINVDKFEAYSEIENYLSKNKELYSTALQYMKNDLRSDVFKILTSETIKENALFFYELKKFVKGHDLGRTKSDATLWLAANMLWVLDMRYKVQKLLGRV